jgi:SAM-dependent methyltransferase
LIDPKHLVESGYDAITDRYAAWAQAIRGSPAVVYLEELIGVIPDGAPVLDLGCGNGEPAGRLLAPGHRYTGVDISSEQLERAKLTVPGDDFIQADFTRLELAPGSFAAVVAVHVFNHVPRDELPALLRRIGRWLEPGGYLLASFGCSGTEGVQHEWLGVPMFFASYTEDETRDLVRAAGFDLVRDEVVRIIEPDEGVADFLWVLARTPPA